jgi:hypothetical protein
MKPTPTATPTGFLVYKRNHRGGFTAERWSSPAEYIPPRAETNPAVASHPLAGLEMYESLRSLIRRYPPPSGTKT